MKPSVRACSPSATRAADPILRPTRIRYRATVSFPVKPTGAATATATRFVTCRGCARRGRRIGRKHRGRGDDHDDDDAGEAFGPSVPVRVAPIRRSPAEQKCRLHGELNIDKLDTDERRRVLRQINAERLADDGDRRRG